MTTKIPAELSSTPGIVDGSNATAITIDSSENVGIGTSSPARNLHIHKASSGATSTSNSVLVVEDDDNTELSILGGSSSVLAINFGHSGDADEGIISFNTTSGSENMIFSSSKDITHTTTSTNSTAGHHIFKSFNTEIMRIDGANNKVGIGVTSPAVLNHISAGYSAPTNGIDSNVFSLISNSASTGSYAGLGILAGTAAASFIHFGDTDDMNVGTLDYFHSDNSMRFSTNGSERMRIASGGAVMIGTTTDVGTSGARVEILNVSSGGRLINTKDVGSGSCNHITFNNSNGQVGRITTSGSATAYVTSSDYRMKENVIDMTNAISRVKELQPKRFNFIADAETTLDGFLAHEVSDIVPEAITGEKDGEEMQGIDQSKLVPLLTKAIQEQQEQIEALQSEINTLKGGD